MIESIFFNSDCICSTITTTQTQQLKSTATHYTVTRKIVSKNARQPSVEPSPEGDTRRVRLLVAVPRWVAVRSGRSVAWVAIRSWRVARIGRRWRVAVRRIWHGRWRVCIARVRVRWRRRHPHRSRRRRPGSGRRPRRSRRWRRCWCGWGCGCSGRDGSVRRCGGQTGYGSSGSRVANGRGRPTSGGGGGGTSILFVNLLHGLGLRGDGGEL